METPHHHEILRPLREIAEGVWQKLAEITLGDVVTDLINGVAQESAARTQEMFSQGELFKD